jgi:hypothetical protein
MCVEERLQVLLLTVCNCEKLNEIKDYCKNVLWQRSEGGRTQTSHRIDNVDNLDTAIWRGREIVLQEMASCAAPPSSSLTPSAPSTCDIDTKCRSSKSSLTLSSCTGLVTSGTCSEGVTDGTAILGTMKSIEVIFREIFAVYCENQAEITNNI